MFKTTSHELGTDKDAWQQHRDTCPHCVRHFQDNLAACEPEVGFFGRAGQAAVKCPPGGACCVCGDPGAAEATQPCRRCLSGSRAPVPLPGHATSALAPFVVPCHAAGVCAGGTPAPLDIPLPFSSHGVLCSDVLQICIAAVAPAAPKAVWPWVINHKCLSFATSSSYNVMATTVSLEPLPGRCAGKDNCLLGLPHRTRLCMPRGLRWSALRAVCRRLLPLRPEHLPRRPLIQKGPHTILRAPVLVSLASHVRQPRCRVPCCVLLACVALPLKWLS